MHLRNELLFSNAFLTNFTPDSEQMGAAYAFMHGARAWYQQADFLNVDSLVFGFIRPLLQNQSLDLTQASPESKAFLLAAPWDPTKIQGLLYVVQDEKSLDGALADGRIPKGQHWMIKAVDCAREQKLQWVILTNGKRWRLLNSQGLRRYEAFLEIDLESLVKSAVPGKEYDQAAFLFTSLFSLEKGLLHDPETDQCGLDLFLNQSNRYTERTEQYLKYAVCDNLDIPGGGDGIIAQLCLGLVRAVDSQGERDFTEAERESIYRDATYLLYRLLFIFYAEARGLLPVDQPEYAEISLRSLVDQAVILHGDPQKAAEQPTSLWKALLSLFNRIDVGDIALQVPAFDGGLFENSQRSYLSQYAIQNPFLADALVQLAFYRDQRNPGSPERIDYRDLSVRHLGSLYEGMIEYRLFIAAEDLLARRDKSGGITFLPKNNTVQKNSDELIPAGQVYFAQSPHERKSTGTHYTLEDLVERLVQQTVLRLLAERWAKFEPEFTSLLNDLSQASPSNTAGLRELIDRRLLQFVEEQVLSLRVCDPAMGSGHFLVHTSHQLTNFILHTLARADWENASVDLDPIAWRHRVVEHCLYGVDINPMAVELAKLSLWLVSMQTDRPLSFLDHHFKHGNSLLGTSLKEIETILNENEFQRVTVRTAVAEERGQYAFRELLPVLETMSKANSLMGKIAAQVVSRVADVHQQEMDYADVEAILAPYMKIGDLLVARKMGLKASANELTLIAKAIESDTVFQLSKEYQAIIHKAEELLDGHSTVHWELEFPRVFADKATSGFNIVIGNPPFIGGLKISSAISSDFLKYLKVAFAPTSGTADLCAYFFRLGFEIILNEGYLGMVSTNTIAQGDTRQTGLSIIVTNNGKIVYADRYVKWGGDANVEVNLIGIYKPAPEFKNSMPGLLDGKIVPIIASFLDDLPDTQPKILVQNQSKAFIGDYLRGTGFIISPTEYQMLIAKNSKNQDCLFPYLIGDDLNRNVEQSPERYIICFFDWEFQTAEKYSDLLEILRERVKPSREQVKQERDKNRWWLYARYRGELRKAILPLDSVMVRSRVSELNMISFANQGIVYGDATVVFAFDDYYHFSLLQSSFHEIWLRRQASTMRTDVRYTPSDCFQTFPFPQIPLLGVVKSADVAARAFYEYRHKAMLGYQLGLTKLYNLFNSPACQETDIIEMRRLHIAMDESVLACYGWQDIDLRHDFYPNDRKKIRFTPAPDAQREIFIRLIDLNQKIAAEEAAKGLAPDLNSEDEEEA